MSKRHCYHHHYIEGCCETRGSRKPTLNSIIILILILLQFGSVNGNGLLGGNNALGNNPVSIDNGILFIIALFYLSCCNTCRTKC